MESNSEEHANETMTVKNLADENVIVEPGKIFQQIYGVIKSKAFGTNTIEEFKERLEIRV